MQGRDHVLFPLGQGEEDVWQLNDGKERGDVGQRLPCPVGQEGDIKLQFS